MVEVKYLTEIPRGKFLSCYSFLRLNLLGKEDATG